MTANRSITAWQRPLAGLFALAAVFALSACGGGSGAPNNPYEPGPTLPSPLAILPPSATVYPGTPTTLTVSGGTLPYRAFSSNPAVLPVATNVPGDQVVLVANPTDADVALAVTIQDSGGQSVPATVTVRPAPLFSGLTVAASGPECGSANVCSGATGTASVTAKGVAGAPLSGRQIKFDVVYGPFAIQSTNPATPLVQTLTVVTDGNGVARVGIQATVDATTQPAQVRATDLTTRPAGHRQFHRRQQHLDLGDQRHPGQSDDPGRPSSTNAAPGSASITSSMAAIPRTACRRPFPSAVSLSPTSVTASGGASAPSPPAPASNPLTFTILDAAGKQTTARLTNKPGSEKRPETPAPTPPPELSISPTTINQVSCTGKTFQFTVVGGTPPYNVVSSLQEPSFPLRRSMLRVARRR